MACTWGAWKTALHPGRAHSQDWIGLYKPSSSTPTVTPEGVHVTILIFFSFQGAHGCIRCKSYHSPADLDFYLQIELPTRLRKAEIVLPSPNLINSLGGCCSWSPSLWLWITASLGGHHLEGLFLSPLVHWPACLDTASGVAINLNCLCFERGHLTHLLESDGEAFISLWLAASPLCYGEIAQNWVNAVFMVQHHKAINSQWVSFPNLY